MNDKFAWSVVVEWKTPPPGALPTTPNFRVEFEKQIIAKIRPDIPPHEVYVAVATFILHGWPIDDFFNNLDFTRSNREGIGALGNISVAWSEPEQDTAWLSRLKIYLSPLGKERYVETQKKALDSWQKAKEVHDALGNWELPQLQAIKPLDSYNDISDIGDVIDEWTANFPRADAKATEGSKQAAEQYRKSVPGASHTEVTAWLEDARFLDLRISELEHIYDYKSGVREMLNEHVAFLHDAVRDVIDAISITITVNGNSVTGCRPYIPAEFGRFGRDKSASPEDFPLKTKMDVSTYSLKRRSNPQRSSKTDEHKPKPKPIEPLLEDLPLWGIDATQPGDTITLWFNANQAPRDSGKWVGMVIDDGTKDILVPPRVQGINMLKRDKGKISAKTYREEFPQSDSSNVDDWDSKYLVPGMDFNGRRRYRALYVFKGEAPHQDPATEYSGVWQVGLIRVPSEGSGSLRREERISDDRDYLWSYDEKDKEKAKFARELARKVGLNSDRRRDSEQIKIEERLLDRDSGFETVIIKCDGEHYAQCNVLTKDWPISYYRHVQKENKKWFIEVDDERCALPITSSPLAPELETTVEMKGKMSGTSNLSPRDSAKKVMAPLKKLWSGRALPDASATAVTKAASGKDPVDQDWCHLWGHGDGGSEVLHNFVAGSKYCNTEQLAIESAQRPIIRGNKKNAQSPEYRLHVKVWIYPEKEVLIRRYTVRESVTNARVPPVARVVEYSVYEKKKNEDEKKLFSHRFDGQSEFFDEYQFRLLGEWVRLRMLGKDEYLKILQEEKKNKK